jgi:carbonic anhydrase
MSEKETAEIPHTRKWLELMGRVKEMVQEHERHNPVIQGRDEEAKRELMTEQLNIVEQMNHLLTYPYIRERYEQGSINILGWYYIIETGEVFNYDVKKQVFEKIV